MLNVGSSAAVFIMVEQDSFHVVVAPILDELASWYWPVNNDKQLSINQ